MEEALESASTVLSADKPIHSSVTIYTLRNQSIIFLYNIVNQLAFLLVLPFFLACNSFRFTAQEIPDPPKAEQIMQIH